MTQRRDFIKQGSLALLGGMNWPADWEVPPPAIQDNGPIRPDNDAVWEKFKQQFFLSPNFIFLNNGTMGPSPFQVFDTVRKTMIDIDQNLSYGGYESACGKIAEFVGANENEIALTHNVTEGINIVAWGLPLKSGDEVIMTTQEHVGCAFPWLNRQKLHGITIRTFTPASTAAETLNRVDALTNKKTRVIAVPHIPCTTGQILPVKEIVKLGKSKKIFVVIDGAHGPGMIPLNLHDLGCDAYASCCHKWMLGPKGTGFLYVRKDFQDTLQAYFVGAGGDNAKWNMATDPVQMGEYAQSAHRYFGGTQNTALYKGVDAAIDFINEIGIENIHKRICLLGELVQKRLMSLGDKIEMITPLEEASRGAVIAFRVKGTNYESIYKLAADNNIRIRMVPENGMNCLRVSTHIYNHRRDIDKFIEVLKTVI